MQKNVCYAAKSAFREPPETSGQALPKNITEGATTNTILNLCIITDWKQKPNFLFSKNWLQKPTKNHSKVPLLIVILHIYIYTHTKWWLYTKEAASVGYSHRLTS